MINEPGPVADAPSTAPRGTSGATMLRTSSSTGLDIAVVAGLAALLAVLAQIAIPTGTPVPITLQTLGVVLAGALLGPWRGFLSVSLYLVVGLAGMPVFTEGRGGVGVLAEPSAGYLLSFPFAALAVGALVRLGARRGWHTRAWYLFSASTAVVLVVTTVPGVLVLGARLDVELATAIGYGAVYIPGDLLKTALAAMVVAEVHRAFPGLLGSRRSTREPVAAAQSVV